MPNDWLGDLIASGLVPSPQLSYWGNDRSGIAPAIGELPIPGWQTLDRGLQPEAGDWGDFVANGWSQIDPGMIIGLGADPRVIDPGFAVGKSGGRPVDPGFFPFLNGPWNDMPLGLAYDSDAALNQPLTSITIPSDSDGSAPSGFDFRVTVDGFTSQAWRYLENDQGRDPGEDYVLSDRLLAEVSTAGVYTYVYDVVIHYPDSGDVVRQFSGTTVLTPQPASSFGQGWSIGGLDRLVDIDDYGVVYQYGQGGSRVFLEDGGGWISPANDAGELTKVGDEFLYTTYDGYVAAFDSDGKLVRRVDPHGALMTYSYDEEVLSLIEAPNSQLTSFVYSTNQVVIELPNGGKATLALDGNGQLTGITLPDDYGPEFKYETSPRLLKGSSWGEQSLTITYDNGGVSSIDRGFNRNGKGTNTTEYQPRIVPAVDKSVPPLLDELNAVIIAGLNLNTTMSLDGFGRPLQFQTPFKSVVTMNYNDAGKLTTLVDPLNRTTTFAYDAGNLIDVVKVTLPDLTSYQYEYVEDGGKSTHLIHKMTDPVGKATTLEWKLDGRDIKAVTLPNKNTTSLVWENGQLVGIIDGGKNTTSFTYYQGRLESLINANKDTISFDYGNTGGGSTFRAIDDAVGRLTTTTYDAMGRLTQIEDDAGGLTTFAYNENGWLTGTTDRLGRGSEFEYDEQGFLTATQLTNTDPYVQQTVFTYSYDVIGRLDGSTNPWIGLTTAHYDSQRLPARIEDSFNNITTITYGGAGQVASVENPLLWRTTFSYDKTGRVETIENPADGMTSFSFDGINNLTKVVTPDGTITTLEYNGDRLTKLIQPIEPGHNWTATFAYDSLDRLIGIQFGPRTGVTSFAYDNLSRPELLGYRWDTPQQHVVTLSYDAVGRVEELIDPITGTVRFAYDPLNRLIQRIDAYGQTSPVVLQRTTTFTYDLEHLLSVESPGWGVTTFAYDLLNRPTLVVRGFGSPDPRAVTVTYDDGAGSVTFSFSPTMEYQVEYDQRMWATAITDPLNRVTTFGYDKGGQLLFMVDPRETITSYGYDSEGRLAQVIRDFGGKAETSNFVYDDRGLLLSQQNPFGTVTSFAYDGLGRPTLIIEGHGSGIARTYTYAYDPAGAWMSVKDPLSFLTTTNFDAIGRPQSIKLPTDALVTYVYDTLDRQIGLIDPLNQGSSFAYDSLNRLIWQKNALGQYTTFVYDAGDRLLSVTAADKTITSFAYNVFGESTLRIDGLGSGLQRTTTIAYDDLGNVLSITNPLKVTTSYAYDDLNRQTQIIAAWNTGHARTTEFDYAYKGEWATVTDPLGTVTSTSFDVLGRPTVLVRAFGETEHWTTTTTYLAGGLTGTITFPRGGVTSYVYDALGQLTKAYEAKGDGLQRLTTYLYDNAGQVLAWTNPVGTETSYAYDGIGQITRLIEANGKSEQRTTTFVYDLAGRVLSVTAADKVTTSYAYDAVGQATATLEAHGAALAQATSMVYDAVGRIASIKKPTGVVTSFAYDELGRLTRTIEDFNGSLERTTSWSYDLGDRLIGITTPDKTVTSFVFSDFGETVRVIEDYGGLNRTTTFEYDAAGRVIAMTDPRLAVTTFGYDHLDRPTAITEALGISGLERTATFAYDPAGLWSSFTQPLDATHSLTTSTAYDIFGRTTKIIEDTAGLKRTTAYAYDAADRLVGVTDPLNTLTSFGYDALGQMTAVVEAHGLTSPLLQRTTTFAYDPVGRVRLVTNALGTQTSFAYDALGRLTQQVEAYGLTSPMLERSTAVTYGYDNTLGTSWSSVTDVLNTATSYNYDRLGRLVVTIVDPGGGTHFNYVTTVTYDAADRVRTVVDALERTTTWSYDALGRLIDYTDRLGGKTVYDYGAVGDLLPTKVTDPLSHATSFAFDALGRMTKMQQPTAGGLNHITTYQYDLADRLIATTNPRGHEGSFTYDALSRLVARRDPLGHAVTFAYDLNDRLTSQRDALDRIVTFTYDALGRMTRSDGPEGVFATFAYDALDRRTHVFDALNQVTSFAYDALSRTTRITDGRGYHTSLSYDAADHLTKLVDPNNNQTSYGYDALGRLIRRTDAKLDIATYTYDGLGRVTSTTDRAAARRDFVYEDGDRRKLEQRYAVGGSLVETLTFTYDAAGNLTGAGNAAGLYTLAYDELNQPYRVDEPFGLVLTFVYDAAGNRTRVEDSRGGLMSSSYDAANRLERREQHTSGTLRLAMDYAYTNADDLLSVIRRNGWNTQVGRTTFTYDPAGRVSALRHQDGSNSTFQTLTYTYDAANRVTALIRNSTTNSFEYDAADQLTTDGSLTFAYDKGGNSTFGPGGTMTYGTGNQLGTWGSKNTYYAFEYDDNGNRIERNYIELLDGEFYNQQYGFDHANRLVSFTSVPNFAAPTTQVDYTYDAFGNRIARLQLQTEDEITTTVSYERYGVDMWEVTQDYWGNRLTPVGNEAANVWVDLDATDSDALKYRRVYSPGWDQVAARLDGSNTARWYLTDRQGSVVGATNESGAPLATITYEAFGATKSGSLIDRYGYTGREWDATAQLYHYRDRAYDPATRRFLQEDPVELHGGDYNFYRYVGNNPTGYTDPSGWAADAGRGGATKLPTDKTGQLTDTIDEISGGFIEADATLPAAPQTLLEPTPAPGMDGLLGGLRPRTGSIRLPFRPGGDVPMWGGGPRTGGRNLIEISGGWISGATTAPSGSGQGSEGSGEASPPVKAVPGPRRLPDDPTGADLDRIRGGGGFAVGSGYGIPTKVAETIGDCGNAALNGANNVANGAAGAADSLTGGLSKTIRGFFGIDSGVDTNSKSYKGGSVGGTVVGALLSLVNPCAAANSGTGVAAALTVHNTLSAGTALGNAVTSYQNGDAFGTALNSLGALGGFLQATRACFVAGTPIRTPGGYRRVEDLRPGDLVVSRSEAVPDAPLTERAIEDVFIRTTAIWQVVVDGQTIGTTSEHPFWVVGRGWIPAGMLEGGERVLAEDGRTLTVESSRDAGRVETVYNFRVADDHTYFVGCPDWGWAVWVHNASYDARVLGRDLEVDFLRPAGAQAAHIVPTGAFSNRAATVQQAIQASQNALANSGVGINSSLNGLWSTVSGHGGTHTDAYFLEMWRTIRNTTASGGSVRDALVSLHNRIVSGAFIR